MSGNGGYNYGNDYSYGHDYSSQTQNLNNNYDYGGYNYPTNSNYGAQSSPYTQPSVNQQNIQQPFNASASLLSNPAAQIGMQFGTQAISAGQEYVNTNVNIIWLMSISK